MNRFFLHTMFFLMLLLATVGKVYAQDPAPPGQEIVNQATVSYTDPRDGEVTLFSNPVEVIVSENPDFDFWPNNSIKEFRGNSVELVHFIRNNGNTIATFDLKGFNTTGDDFDMQDLSWTTSSVGKFSTIQNTDTLTSVVTLNPGETFEIGYVGWISLAEERDTLTSFMVFEATDIQSGITKTNIDTIGIRIGAIVDIEKQQIGADELRPNDSFQYEISGVNTGDMTAFPRRITVDGFEMERVILTDSLPANVSFTSFDEWSKGTPLYSTGTDDKYDFTITPPEDLTTVELVGLAFDSLQVGESFSVSFSVQVRSNASGLIINTAELSYTDPEGDVVTAAASNSVATEILDGGAEIDYFTGEDFEEKTATSSIGEPLHIQATASSCNENRSAIEIVDIYLDSELTLDSELFKATETGENTGVFRIEEEVPTRDGTLFEVVEGNMILETVEEDVIIATLVCSGLAGGGGTSAQIEASVIVDPFGFVFDSETNEIIPGAEIRLIDVTGENNGGNPGGLADVYLPNGNDVATNEQLSTELGKFRYPFIRPGTYRLEVIPPEGYDFASILPADHFSDRNVDSLASYGSEFEVTGDPIGLDFDIPLDASINGVLMAQKEVNQTRAELGDYVNYTITIKSASVNTLDSVIVEDELPFGFEYQPGSARLNGEPLVDPEGGKGPSLVFDLQTNIEPGETLVLQYRVYIGPGAERSDGINSALVRTGDNIERVSNQAKVKIEVTGGVFSDEAFIVGKVFLDCNEDNMQDASEKGIPGVRLYLEDGTYVITDAEGKYSFYGVKANKHVLKLDNYSLPEGSRMKVLDNRHAFDPSSRFVDVTKGELHRADFAVCECTAEVNEEIERRKSALNGNSDIVGNALKQNFSTNENANRGAQARFGQASGTIGNAAQNTPIATQQTPGEDVQTEETLTEVIGIEDQSISIEEVLEKAEPGTEILNVVDGDTLDFDKVTLWAKGTNGALFDIFVNGIVVPASRIGQRSSSNTTGQQIWEYVSIQLEPGENNIMLQEGDPFGNVRGRDEITVFVPGALAEIRVTVPVNDVAADGTSFATVKVETVDEIGLPVGSRLPLMLDIEMGTWMVVDENTDEQGIQTFIEGGIAEFQIKAPIQPFTSKVRASVGDISGEAKVEFLPDLRPLIAAGIIEGSVRLRDPLNIQSNVENDGFEEELKSLSYDMNNFVMDGRFAFFLKGKISGKTLLTASFDSEEADEERLFRDIRPDEYYPVYGDASIRGYDAQSSTRLYIRVDRNKTYALYGDFITMDNRADIQLGGYTRSQTGVRSHFEEGRVSVDAFGVSSVSSRRVSEFRGQGISRYELPDKDLIDNSEIIELITYDRDQILSTDSLGVPDDPTLILTKKRLTRFTDYTVDPFSGVITFRTPVSSVDAEFNPVYIRATYEVENDEERYLIGGIGANVEIVDGFNIGGNVVQDNNPNNEFTLAAGNINAQLGEDTKVVAEIAHTQNEGQGNGTAGRVQLNHQGERFDVLTSFSKSSEDFNNTGASLGESRTEARLNSRFKIGTGTNLNTEFLLTRNDTTGDQTIGGLVTVQQKLGSGINAEVGVRYSDQTYSNADDVTNTNLRSKITAQLPFITGASTFGEYEQDLNVADQRLIAVGADYRIRNFAKAYARHEFSSSAGGVYTLNKTAQKNSTVIGLDADYMKGGQIFSEYRMNDVTEGRSGQASIGLRNRFQIREGLGMNAGFERIFTVTGNGTNDGTSFTTSIDYTGSTRWKGTARAEARFGETNTSYLNSLGYGLSINNDWSFLARNIISVSSTNNASGVQNIEERLQIGAAYRDTYSNMFDALFRYEFKLETDESIAPNYLNTAHVLTSTANYKPNAGLVFSGRIAAKYSLVKDDQTRETSFLELVSGRVTKDLNERWDAGINASLLANSDFTTKDYGLGVELGYILARNLRLAGGFNFFGYEDDDLTANNYTQPGAYLGFAYKFDEQVFRNLAPNRMGNLIDENMYLTCIPCSTPEPKAIALDTPEHTLDPVEIMKQVLEYESYARLVILPQQVHFDNNMSYINMSTAQMLDKLAKYLVEEEEYIVDLNGFTDAKASDAYNKALSERRALAVRAYLVAAGVEKRKLFIEGFGEQYALADNMVDMSLERKVEFDLNELNDEVTYVSQVEDLQINQKVQAIGDWDYIFKSEHNAVPNNINLQPGSNQLNYLNRYMVQRIAMALDKYPGIAVRISIPADDRFPILQQQILEELSKEDSDINRYMFMRGGQGEQDVIRIEYFNSDHLVMMDQQDDVKFLNNNQIPELLENMLRVLKSRVDYELIHDLSQSYVVPDRVNFMRRTSLLDNESQAVVSRIGSYLRNNPEVYLELSGDGSQRDRNRMYEMVDYLEEWGVDINRILISKITVVTDGTAIRVEYKNADSINLLNIESLNLRPGARGN